MKFVSTPHVALCLAFLCCFWSANAQTTIAFQGGEGTPADNWGFVAVTNAGGGVPPGIVAASPRTGSFALRAGGGNNIGCTSGTNCITGGANSATGCAMHGNTIQFNAVNVACLAGVSLSVYHQSQPSLCSGAGFDGSDNLNFEVRLDGGAWTTIQTMATVGDYLWTYATNPAGIPATVPNPWVYAVPPGTSTFEFRVRATVNRSDEVFYLDDVTLTTTSTGYGFPGTAGLWNGIADDNWFNPCNWDDRQVPTAATNVTFPTGSNNDIVIQAGQNCQCNDILCTGGAGHMIKAEGNPLKVLTVFGNLTNATTAGSTVLDFSDGISGTPDGTLNLHGNWTNNSSSGDFVEGESTVNFLGAANQAISLGTVQPTEDFFNVSVSKSGGDVVLAKSIQIGGVLNLTNGKVTTAANAAVVANPLPGAVINHSTASYINGNLLRAIQTGAGTRAYDYPLGTPAFYELATLTLTNPSGFSVIGGFFNPLIGGVPPSIVEAGDLYDRILNAGVWTLAPDLPFVGSYDITLQERGYTNGGATKYINVKRPDALGIWTNPGTHAGFTEVGGVVTCTRTGLSTFSDFAIALYNVPLQEGDVKMQATPTGGSAINIEWTWDSQEMNGQFELLRSVGGNEISLGDWPIGNNAALSTEDLNAPAGLIRYELYHTDVNGNRTHAATDEVWNSIASEIEPRLWPNPNDGEVNLQLSDAENCRVELIGIYGDLIAEWKGSAAEVQSRFEESVPTLAPGVYFVKCITSGRPFILRMVRQ